MEDLTMGEYNELYHHGIKGQKWGIRRTAAQLGHRKSKKSAYTIGDTVFKKEVHNGQEYVHGKLPFGGNDQCNVYADGLLNSFYVKSIVNNLYNNKKLQKEMHDQSLNELYDAYENHYRKADPSAKSMTKQEFDKHLKCDEINIIDPYNYDGPKKHDAVCYYTTDFYGDWSMEVNSTTGKIVYSEFYR